MDRVSPDARAAEAEIDQAFRTNPLLRLDFGAAAINALAPQEHDLGTMFLGLGGSPHALNPMSDWYIAMSRQVALWLKTGCAPEGDKRLRPARSLSNAASDLWSLARAYTVFARAYTLASQGAIGLSLEGNRLVADQDLTKDLRYEACNRLAGLGGRAACSGSAEIGESGSLG